MIFVGWNLRTLLKSFLSERMLSNKWADDANNVLEKTNCLLAGDMRLHKFKRVVATRLFVCL